MVTTTVATAQTKRIVQERKSTHSYVSMWKTSHSYLFGGEDISSKCAGQINSAASFFPLINDFQFPRNWLNKQKRATASGWVISLAENNGFSFITNSLSIVLLQKINASSHWISSPSL